MCPFIEEKTFQVNINTTKKFDFETMDPVQCKDALRSVAEALLISDTAY